MNGGLVPIGSARRRKLPDDELPPDDRDAPDLPVIKIGTDLHRVVDATVAALAHDRELFQRDGALVRVVRVAETDAVQERMAVGTPQIRTVGIATLRERATRMAGFRKYDKRSKAWVPTLPPDVVISAAAERGEWPGIRPIVGIIETPSMRPDGTIIDKPGHDAVTGYVYAPQREYPQIKERPTRDDARAALAALVEPFQDFPFRGEPDRYVPVAAIMSLACRPAFRGPSPAMLKDASTRGSGKTLAARAVTALAQGREAALVTWPSEDAEAEKILGSYALRGASAIVWDNVTGTFGGGALDKVLTCADRVELRVLGKSEVPALSWRAVTIATGNNIVLGGDTTRRVLVSRLEPDCEKPEERTGFAIGDLMAWCRENHPRIIGSALTVARAYIVAGREDQNLPGWGSYEAWRDLIASSIVWAGGPNVMETRPTMAGEDDTETAALRSIVELWPMIAPEGESVRAAINVLYPTLQRGEPPTDGKDGLREALESLAPPKRAGDPPNALTLGKALGRHRRRVVGNKYLDHASKSGGIAKWKVFEVQS